MKTARKKLSWMLIAVFMAINLAGLCWLVCAEHELQLTAQEIQCSIDEKLPFSTDSDIEVTRVELDMNENQIRLKFDASMNKMETVYDVTAETVGSLRYESSEAAFYFHPESIKLLSVKANGVPLSSTAGTLLYFLSQEQKAAFLARTEAMLQSFIQAAAQSSLRDKPVYVLPADTWFEKILQATLKTVEVKTGKLVVRLSLWQLAKQAVLPVLLLAFALVAVVKLIRRYRKSKDKFQFRSTGTQYQRVVRSV